jgi:PAS domain S-box-containing protein
MQDFLTTKEENTDLLQQAYEFGIDAIETNLSIWDITEIHEKSLERILANYNDASVIGQIAIKATKFLTQSLLPIEESRQQRSTSKLICDHGGEERLPNLLKKKSKDCKQTETLQIESEERFRSIFEQAAVGVTYTDLRGQFLQANQKFCDIIGYTPAEIITLKFQDITHPDDIAANEAYVYQLLAGKISDFSLDKRYLRKDGSIIWANINVSLFCDSFGKAKYLICTTKDISDHKKLEETLRYKEEQLKLALELNHIGCWDWRIETGSVDWDDNNSRLLGLVPGEIQTSHQLWKGTVHPEDIDRLEQAIADALTANTKFEIEYRVVYPDGGIHWLAGRGHGICNETGNSQRVIGVTFDISERKWVETALQQLNAELETKVEERTSNLAQINQQLVAEITKHQYAQERLDQTIKRLHWINKLASNLNEANSCDEIYHVTLQAIQHIFETERAAILIFDDRGVPRYQASIGISEAYKQAVENYCESLTKVPQTELVIVSDAAQQPGVELLDTMRKAEDIKAAVSFPMAYQGQQLGKIAVYYDFPYQFTEEEVQLVQTISTYTAVAITRKQAETELQESQRFVQSIADSTPDILYVYDMIEHRNIYINQACLRILGYTPEELLATGSDLFSNLMHPDDLALLRNDVQRLHSMKTGEVAKREYRMKNADGEWRWLCSRETIFSKDPDGRTKQIIGVVRDISDRKDKEQQLRQQSEAMEASVDGIAIVNHSGIFTYANKAHAKIFGYSSTEAMIGKSWEDLYDQEVIDYVESTVMPSILAKGIWQGELVGNKKDGSHFPVEVSITAIAGGNGVCIYRDISDRKRAEAEVRETQMRFQSVLDSCPAGIYVFDKEGKHLLVNRYYEQSTGQTNAELFGKSIYELWSHDIAERTVTINKQIIESGVATEFEEEIPQSDGLHTYVTIRFPLFNEQGVAYAACGISTDITARKQAEEELRETQQFLQSILDNFPGAINVFDQEDKHVLVNHHVEKILSQTNAELHGKSIREVLLPDFAARVSAENKQVFESGMPLELEGVVPQSDGLHTYVTNKFPLFNEQGIPYAVCGISTDITARKQAEIQLQESLEEKEVLLKEIHHRVKNNLQVVASLLNLQKRTIADPAIAQLFEESKNRVYAMAMIHERLYQSKQLNQVSLGKYLQDLVDALAQSNDIQSKHIQFQVDADAIDVNIETAMPCGLIVNELVTNAIKHAFPDLRQGQVLIKCHGTSNGQILLVVCDNGVGMPKDVAPQKASSLGLRITNNLTRQLRGTIEIDTSDNGTCFSLKFAELAYQNRI